MKSGGSAGMLIYRRILSTDIILFSKVHKLQTTEACRMFRLSPYVTARPAIPESWALRKDFELIYYSLCPKLLRPLWLEAMAFFLVHDVLQRALPAGQPAGPPALTTSQSAKQAVSCFGFFRCIIFAMHLDIYYV